MRSRRLPLVVLATALGSLVLLGVADRMGWAAHGLRPMSLGTAEWVVLFVLSWTLMTATMMLPSLIPFLDAVWRMGGAPATCVAAFGYLSAWAALGALLCGALWLGSDALARLPPGAPESVAGLSLIAAAAYQLTTLARQCQRICSRPFAILALHWHGREARRSAALAAGLHYALSCMGCCVSMIVLMLVVGVSDLIWMLALAGLMMAHKNMHWGPRLVLPGAAALAIAGVAIGAGWWQPALHGLRALCGA